MEMKLNRFCHSKPLLTCDDGLGVGYKMAWVPGVFAKAHCASMYFPKVQYQPSPSPTVPGVSCKSPLCKHVSGNCRTF